MGSLNKVILIGNLGRDAEMRYTPSGVAVSTLNLATTESWKDKQTGEKKEDTQWHRVIVWGRTAEALQDYLTKGKSICVEGKLQTRKWTDKEGVDKYTTEIKADRVVLLGGGKDGGGGSRRTQHVSDEAIGAEPSTVDEAVGGGSAEVDDDDIPF